MAFPHLPGFNVVLNDLGLRVSPQPAGPKVTLLGITSSEDITPNEPFIVTNVGKAAAALYFSGAEGTKSYPGELSLAIEEAFLAGAGAVEVVVTATGIVDTRLDSYLDPADVNGQRDRYGDLIATYDAIKDTQLDVVVPVGAWADATGVTGGFMNQLANFCYQATTEFNNACFGVIGMMPVLHWAKAWSGELALGNTALASEVDGLTGQDFWRFATPSLALVNEWQKYAVQQNTPVVATSNADFPTVFDNYLDGSEDTGGVFYPQNDENEATDVNASYFSSWRAQSTDGVLQTDGKGNLVDVGARLCVVGGPVQTTNSQIRSLAAGVGGSLAASVYNTDGAASYAGFITSLQPHSATTNKVIRGTTTQRTLSSTQVNELVGRRITTFVNRPRGFVVASGVTGAHNVSKFVRSDFVRLSTVRVVDAAIGLIRELGERFIGEPNTAAHRNALGAEIDKALTQMKQANALNDFQFFVKSTNAQQVLGEVDIELTLVPAFETLKITTNVSLASEIL